MPGNNAELTVETLGLENIHKLVNRRLLIDNNLSPLCKIISPTVVGFFPSFGPVVKAEATRKAWLSFPHLIKLIWQNFIQ